MNTLPWDDDDQAWMLLVELIYAVAAAIAAAAYI
jgi:hypothetical protein